MPRQYDYNINLDRKFGFLKLIHVAAISKDVKERWFNQTLCKVNDCVVRLGVFNERDFHWHKHDNEDEFFFVVKGALIIDLEKETITLQPNQGFAIPHGVVHKTRVSEPTVVLMFEGGSVNPTGDEQ